MMRNRILLAAVVAAGLAGVTCAPDGPGPGDPAGVDTPWAQGAVELFDSIALRLDDADRHAAATYFSDGGVLDLRAWGGDVYAGRLAIAEALGTILYIAPRARLGADSGYPELDVHVDQVFLGTRQAVVRFDAQYLAGGVPWMQLYAVGDTGVASSRLYTESLGHVSPPDRWTDEPEHPFYDRYVEVWSSGDPDRLAELYTPAVAVRDSFARERWAGLDDLAGTMGSTPAIDHGPWPELFRFDAGGRHEQIAVFQLAGRCPALEARRWVFHDGLIADETRYPHVASVRRCEGSVGDGWWTDLEVTGSDDFAVETVVIGERSMDLVNADEPQADLVRWLFGRFADGALAAPDVAAFWFPPSVDCGLSEAIARPADERFQGGHTVTLCFTSDEISSGWPGRRWSYHVAHQGLHELAHVWMYDHLDDPHRAAFLDRVGLDSWRDAGTFWPERGVEVAAETMAWGLAEEGGAEYLIKPAPDCAELAERYVMLTGHDPLTTCDATGDG
jgi:hypothetical protein